MLWLLSAPTTSGCSPPHRGLFGFLTRHHLLAAQVLEMKTWHVEQTLPARLQMPGGHCHRLLVWDSSILNCGRVPREQVPTIFRSQQRPRQGCQGVSEMRCTRSWRRASSEGLCCDSHAPTCTRRSRGTSSPHFLPRERGFLRTSVRAGPCFLGLAGGMEGWCLSTLRKPKGHRLHLELLAGNWGWGMVKGACFWAAGGPHILSSQEGACRHEKRMEAPSHTGLRKGAQGTHWKGWVTLRANHSTCLSGHREAPRSPGSRQTVYARCSLPVACCCSACVEL